MDNGILADAAEKERGDAIIAFDKALNLIKGATGISAFVAVANLALGTFLMFFPNVITIGGMFDPDASFGYILFGLLFLGLSVGIGRRSRVCAVLALVALAVDAVMMLMLSYEMFPAIFMRAFFLIGLLSGVTGSFSYHKLRNKYKVSEDPWLVEYTASKKAKTKTAPVVLYIVAACIGLGAMSYGFTQAGTAGRSFEDWVDYSYGMVTVKMPNPRIKVESEPLDDLPGVTHVIAESVTAKCEVVLIVYDGIWLAVDAGIRQTGELETAILSEYVNFLESDMRVTGWSEGIIGSETYWDMHVEHNGNPGVFRCFSGGDDMYIAVIIMHDSDEEGFIEKFLNSIS